MSTLSLLRSACAALPHGFLKGLLAAALGLGWAASAAAMDITGWECTPGPMPNASCGTLGADGVVSLPATELPYGWVSSRGGVVASIVIPDSIKSHALSATNASRIDSPVFHANAGDVLSFNFNYVTSDGGIYTDFAWARLLDMDGHDVAILFTARTMPTGDTVPGFNMPAVAPGLTLTPASTPIQAPGYHAPAPGPSWSPLGTTSSGLCYAAGCGYTGWVHADYTIPATGHYRLEFGVANWVDTAYDSGLAFYGAKIGATLIEEVGKPDLVPHLTGPAEVATGTRDHYTVTILNQGGADSADGTITLHLPADATLEAGYFPLPGYCTPTAGPPGSFTCNLPAIESGKSLEIEFVISSSTPGSGLITGMVSGVTNESNTLNNDTELPVIFVAPPGAPDLTTSISGPLNLPAGATGNYTVTVRNIGSADSEDGTVLITVPADVTVIAASLPAYCHLATATQISCDLAQAPPIPAPLIQHHVEPGDDLLIPFQLTTATPNHTGSIHATVTGVTLAEPEVIVDNNSSTYLLNNTRIIPRVEPGEVAVPALEDLALLLLALTLAGSAAVRMRLRGKPQSGS